MFMKVSCLGIDVMRKPVGVHINKSQLSSIVTPIWPGIWVEYWCECFILWCLSSGNFVSCSQSSNQHSCKLLLSFVKNIYKYLKKTVMNIREYAYKNSSKITFHNLICCKLSYHFYNYILPSHACAVAW